MSWTCDQKIACAACDLEPLSGKLARFLRYEQAQSRRPQGWCRVTEVVAQPFMQQRSEELVKVILENRNEDNHLRFEMEEYEQELWVCARWARWGPWEIPFKPPPRRRPTPPQVRPAPKPASTAPTPPPPPPQQYVLDHATSSLERGWVFMTHWPKESSGIWLDAKDSNIFFYVDEPDMWAAYLGPTKNMRKYWWNSITDEWFYVNGGPSYVSILGQEELQV